MTPQIVSLVLIAALLHASWNALLKSDDDRFRSVTVMSLASSLASVPFLFILPLPNAAAWPSLLISAILHVGYNLFLVRAYRHGELGQVYPIARGSSPLLVTIGAALVAEELPSPLALTGIVLVSVGILSLARGWSGASKAGMLTAFGTGAFIAAYTVTDGLGGRLSGDPLSYAAWLFAIYGLPMAAVYRVARGRTRTLFTNRGETLKSSLGGVVSLIAYAAVIWAASIGPMGSVSALRETSVVFAALIGRVFLADKLTVTRLASCGAVALGAIVLTG